MAVLNSTKSCSLRILNLKNNLFICSSLFNPPTILKTFFCSK